ncbi:hypothetical protein BGM19_35235 [Streptomyces agglomeratus]|uniref:Uncharacterized protein n=1 Tax=Streptomyces agglomeratus TaxID=285458 RepID=A0A1E5P1H2_9ACTN|nr:hypothetical protein AS594_01610 [Streptomyces agglomeratus]OEJ55113.1 hypothetical protein BGK72_34290 [Streptomyces agglomeratus]OEJ62478.1 hypothetical protein BGM19_35235 [Streptomyces agglomeratus]
MNVCSAPGDDEQFEVLACGNEPVGQPQGVVRVEPIVHFAVDQEEFARQAVGQVAVGGVVERLVPAGAACPSTRPGSVLPA